MQVLLLLLSIGNDPKPTDCCCWCKPDLGWNVQKWHVGDSFQPLFFIQWWPFRCGIVCCGLFSHSTSVSQRTHWFKLAQFIALLHFLETLHGGGDVSCACFGLFTPSDFLGICLALPVDTLDLNKQHRGAVGLGVHPAANLGEGVQFNF